jgi:hypothetical protein
MLPLLLAYMTLLTFASLRRNGEQVGVSLALLANWLLSTAFVRSTGEDAPWLWFLTVDYLTGIVLWLMPRSRGNSLLMASYAVELLLHAAFGWSDQGGWARYRYWWALYYAAWAQVALVGAWSIYDAARHRLGDRPGIPSADISAPDPTS